MKERNEINAARCKQQIEGDEMGWLLSLVVGYGRCSANGSAQERRQQQQPINSSSIMRNKRNGTTSELSSAAINLAAVQWREVEPPLPPRRDTFSSSPPTNEVKLVGYGPEAPLPPSHFIPLVSLIPFQFSCPFFSIAAGKTSNPSLIN